MRTVWICEDCGTQHATAVERCQRCGGPEPVETIVGDPVEVASPPGGSGGGEGDDQAVPAPSGRASTRGSIRRN